MSSAAPSFLHGTAMLVIWGSVDHPSTTNTNTDTDTNTNTTTAVDETALNAWWTNEHLPERLAIPGFHRTRRYYNYTQTTQTTLDNTQTQTKIQTPVPSSQSSQYLVTYEVSSLSTLTSPAYMTALNNPTEGTKRFMPVLASMNRSACRVLYSVAREEFSRTSTSTTTGDDHSSTRRTGIGAALAHIVFQPPSGTQDNLRKWIEEIGWPSLAAFPTPLAMHLLEHDDEATKSGSATKSYEDVTFQTNTNTKPGEDEGEGKNDTDSKGRSRWMLLIEFAEPLGAPFGKASALTGTVVDKLDEMDAKEIDVRLYGLICTVSE
ncbi:hypothetical protein LTR92_008357 [Exophiala xenobiotica]|nr:hypothetical protein LTR92_008357 [Exophiala xenobiotica]KAK5552856.1 hypothetical protein LTR46_009272 [Exophiala xenobiotica]